jgi:chromosome transmission fidelity protein 18
MNLQRVSFIDPSFDRCSAVLEWMSSTDCYRSNKQLSSADGYFVEAIHTPAVAAATHILCRVEQPQDLIYSIRDLTESQYQMESNKALIQKFLDGLCLRAKSSRSGLYQASSEIVPHALWILSAGEGSSALNRSVTSVDLLSKSEKDAFEHHSVILQSLGLKHVSMVHENDQNRRLYRSSPSSLIGFDPPIERLANFVDMSNDRLDIPPAVSSHFYTFFVGFNLIKTPFLLTMQLKQMLSRKAVIDKNTATITSVHEQPRKSGVNRMAAKNESTGVSNFLLMGAKNAKALRSARSAARVGCIVNDSHHNQLTRDHQTQRGRLSNTGSGMPIKQVVRLRYVKGFTQAVSMPCRLDDLS